MSLFVCKKCGCVENTAISSYWPITCVSYKKVLYDKSLNEFRGMPLCSECAKLTFVPDREEPIVIPGKWHGKFPKVLATNEQLSKMNPKTRIISL